MTVEKNHNQEIVIVTGPAGAGRTTAINALEDMGYETITNLPLSLFSRVLSGPAGAQALAIGVDTRTRDFSVESLLKEIAEMEKNPDLSPVLFYLDCSDDVLLRRFSETRRRHPQAGEGTPTMGIELEGELLQGLRDRADILLDTSEMSPHELRSQIDKWFSRNKTTQLGVSVQSFSYKRGTPRGVDMVIDCRFLNNPHWEESLRALTGMNQKVAQYVANDPNFDAFFAKLCDLIDLLLPAYHAEGKAYFSIAMGCTGGKHRSVSVAEKLAAHLEGAGWMVSKRHREMERRNVAGTTGKS